MQKKSLVLLSVLALACTQAFAETPRTLIAPDCLLKATPGQYTTLTQANGFSVVQTNEAGVEALALAKHQAHCGGFRDVSRDVTNTTNPKTLLNTTPRIAKRESSKYQIRYPQQTTATLAQLQPQTMWNNLAVLSSSKDRYANSDLGVKAAEWIKTQVETIAKQTGHTDVTTYFVATGNEYKQPSLVVKLGTSNEPGIVIGGHMDTLSSKQENKPGADDDGSGSVTVLETARTLMASGMHFKKPIYFIWYSAEEMGLVGSGYVVADFKAKHIPVSAALQMDMTGYEYHNDPSMWLITDHVNGDLTTFTHTLIDTYVKRPVKLSTCGYACSDHASWDSAGIPAAFPFEARMGDDDPDIHTARDTMEKLSLDHMTDYLKLATAFAVELAEPVA